MCKSFWFFVPEPAGTHLELAASHAPAGNQAATPNTGPTAQRNLRSEKNTSIFKKQKNNPRVSFSGSTFENLCIQKIKFKFKFSPAWNWVWRSCLWPSSTYTSTWCCSRWLGLTWTSFASLWCSNWLRWRHSSFATPFRLILLRHGHCRCGFCRCRWSRTWTNNRRHFRWAFHWHLHKFISSMRWRRRRPSCLRWHDKRDGVDGTRCHRSRSLTFATLVSLALALCHEVLPHELLPSLLPRFIPPFGKFSRWIMRLHTNYIAI